MTMEEALAMLENERMMTFYRYPALDEAVEKAISYIKKQIPKPPVLGNLFTDKSDDWRKQYGISWKIYKCPACDWPTGISTISKETVRPNYCNHCGQALDWEGYRNENQPCE